MDVLLSVKLLIIMFRDLILMLSEFFFWLLGGVPLMNTLWIVPYILVLTMILVLPYFFFVFKLNYNKFAPLIFLVSFFPILLIGMGPPIVQVQMLQECETVEQVVSTDRVENHKMDIKQCRVKENYYGEFGEWKIYGDGK